MMRIEELTNVQMTVLSHLKYTGVWKPFADGKSNLVLNGFIIYERTFESLFDRGLISYQGTWKNINLSVDLTERAKYLMHDEEKVTFELLTADLPTEITFEEYAVKTIPTYDEPLLTRLRKLMMALMHEVSELGYTFNICVGESPMLTDANRTQVAYALGEVLLYIYAIAKQIGVSVDFIKTIKIKENTND
jgi:hypothetical protein